MTPVTGVTVGRTPAWRENIGNAIEHGFDRAKELIREVMVPDTIHGDFDGKPLANLTRFVIDVGANGFNAYKRDEDGSLELFAASSSMSTYIKVMETIANFHLAEGDIPARFLSAEAKDATATPL